MAGNSSNCITFKWTFDSFRLVEIKLLVTWRKIFGKIIKNKIMKVLLTKNLTIKSVLLGKTNIHVEVICVWLTSTLSLILLECE